MARLRKKTKRSATPYVDTLSERTGMFIVVLDPRASRDPSGIDFRKAEFVVGFLTDKKRGLVTDALWIMKSRHVEPGVYKRVETSKRSMKKETDR